MDTKAYANMPTSELLEQRRIQADLADGAQAHVGTIDAILRNRDKALTGVLGEAVRLSWVPGDADDLAIDFVAVLRRIREAGYTITKEG